MVAQVVPITRLRRDTTSWSYQVPAGSPCQAGSLVSIPLQGRQCLGIVWELSDTDAQATRSCTVLTPTPLLRLLQRQFVEWLSQAGLCSLSTALYQYLPAALRRLPLSRSTETALKQFSQWQPPTEAPSQHCILAPSVRPTTELKQKFGSSFQEIWQDSELEMWLAIARGEVRVGLGRERALFAPWLNLRQLTVLEPEAISYYHEQTPYLNLVEAAQALARISHTNLNPKSQLPQRVAEMLWPGSEGLSREAPSLTFVDLKHSRVINPELVAIIQKTLAEKKQVLLYCNARDRLKFSDGMSKLVPGVQTLAKQLALALSEAELPEGIHLGTREIFNQPYQNVGLTGCLCLDPLLSANTFADQVHGWADLGQLFRYEAPCWIQTYQLGHPLVQALANKQFIPYLVQQVAERKNLGLPPFGQYLVCAIETAKSEAAQLQTLLKKLQPLVGEPWQVSSPGTVVWRKKEYRQLFLHGPEDLPLPANVRRILLSLPSPWKVQRNPWYLF